MIDFEDPELRATLLGHAADIVCAFVSHNAVPADALPGLIARAYETLRNISLPPMPADEAPSAPVPAVAVRKSVTDDYLVCLEDGKKFKSLKRHLRTQYNLSPAEYRDKWGLSSDYPMVAPNYARARSELAKTMGLGTQRKKTLTPRTASGQPTTRKSAKAAA